MKIINIFSGDVVFEEERPLQNEEDLIRYIKELLSQLEAGQKAIAELKTAKLDSARLIVQEKVNDDLRCCGNCRFYQSGTDCIEWNHWNHYCGEWQSDQLTRDQRMKK